MEISSRDEAEPLFLAKKRIVGCSVLMHSTGVVASPPSLSSSECEPFEKLARSDLGLVTVTDTVAIDPVNRPENVDVLPVSRLLAETIMNVFGDESVSAIFAGENQLF